MDKFDQKRINSLARSVSSLSDISMDSKGSTSSLASTVAPTSTTAASTTISMYENGFSLEDWAMPGYLSLKDLNTLLLKYIGQVQDKEVNKTKPGTNTSIKVNIDRTELIDLKTKYDDQLQDYKKQCEEKDSEIGSLKAELTKLKAKNKKLKESNNEKDGVIKEKDLAIEGFKAETSKLQANLVMFQNQKEIYDAQIERLNNEVSSLTGELNVTVNMFSSEQIRNQDLSQKMIYMEKELWFKIDALGKELALERSKSNVDISPIVTRLQEEYKEKLRAELKILRKMYEEHMRESEETLQMNYKKKISDLEVALAVQLNAVKPNEDVTELKIDLEKYRKKIEELDTSNRDLNNQWSKLTVEIKEKESAFQAKMAAKEIEMSHLAIQNAEYKKKYEEMRSKLLHEASELKVYNRLITPEMDRMVRSNEHLNGETTTKTSESVPKGTITRKVRKETLQNNYQAT